MRNFKKIFSIALTLIIVTCFAACEEKKTDYTPQNVEEAAEKENVISKDKRFKVVEGTKDGQVAYIYTLYDSYGNVMLEQTVVKEPHIKYITDDILEICNSYGTSAQSCTYFDLKTNKLSDICWNPSYVDGNVVVYMHYDEAHEPNTFLIIRNIFDKEKLYKEVDLDFSPLAVPSDAIKSVKSVDDDTLEIVYLKGEREIETTTVIDL